MKKDEMTRLAKLDEMSFEEKDATVKSGRAGVQNEEMASEGSSRYVVKSGDTLEKIAKAHKITVAQLQRWNKLRTTRIGLGQELLIHIEAQQVKLQTAAMGDGPQKKTSGDGSYIRYVVKKGDTVWDIARAHNVEQTDLLAWNHMSEGKIYPGKELIIYKDKFATVLKQ
jgi:LysM repeat protein